MDLPHVFPLRLARILVIPGVLRWLLGQRVFAVAMLTWRAAFRFRLFWVLLALLLGSVVVLPLLIQDDGTARGFIQIMLTYTLSVITALLGFATLWLACGTLARDIEDCSMQMVVVKPVGRWQVWLGKFTGILLLNAVLLTLSGLSVYGLLKWRAARMEAGVAKARQEENEMLARQIQQEVNILNNEIFVARAALREPLPDIEGTVNAAMRKLIRETGLPPEQQEETRRLLLQEVRSRHQEVPPNHLRRWTIELGLLKHTLRDTPMFLRVKFNVAQTNATGTYLGLWNIGPPDSRQVQSVPQSLAADTFHEIAIPPNLFDDSGRLTIDFENRNNIALIFPLDEGLEVLYREGGFGLNYARGLAVIFCWLSVLAAVGLAAGSLLSFPVAVFCCIGVVLFATSLEGLVRQIGEGTIFGEDHETGAGRVHLVDPTRNRVYQATLNLIEKYDSFSAITPLSTGRSITWGHVADAFARIVLLLGGLVSLVGIALFSRRELASVQLQT